MKHLNLASHLVYYCRSQIDHRADIALTSAYLLAAVVNGRSAQPTETITFELAKHH